MDVKASTKPSQKSKNKHPHRTKPSTTSLTPSAPIPPLRQIRAQFTPTTITVYQAYSVPIATAAVTTQRLTASPLFSTTRMTWIKPSWNWAMYRSGYSFKDNRQARILALEMPHARFVGVLSAGVLSHIASPSLRDTSDANTPPNTTRPAANRTTQSRIQWDPERGPRLEKLEYRSI